MEDKVYNVRMHFNHGNAINLDLKGCGTLYIIPGRDYYFVNAPMNFINYLAQLKRCGITYEITPNKKGCYQEVDLRAYCINDPLKLVSLLRQSTIVTNSNAKQNKIEEKEESKHVVLTSDDIIIADKKVEELNNKIVEDIKKEEVIQEEVINEPENTPQEEVDENKEPTIYTEDELSKLSKLKLLEIANDLGITNVSDINTKKEIREAILVAQK